MEASLRDLRNETLRRNPSAAPGAGTAVPPTTSQQQ
jgi:hypothetical protein